jgi:phosphomannomutase
MLAALHVLAALGEQDKPASELFSIYERYVASGEVNSRVDDAAATVAAIEDTYGDREGITVDHLDGLTVDAGQWWFNVRASNTEPLLRLNVEAGDAATMERVRDEVLALITGAPEVSKGN